MIQYLTGNLLDSNAQALVNTVNTVGVMGKGIALQFKERFPHNFKIYKQACNAHELRPGTLLVVREQTLNGEKVIINFPAKTEWHRKSSYSYIETGLVELARLIKAEQLQSVAVPPLGCGNGGLNWDKVRPMIEHHLSDLQTHVFVYEPSDAIKQVLQQPDTRNEAKLTPARAMLLYALFSYERMGEETSLFVANKLAYFLQRLGENLKLNFVAHHYGPYAPQIAHVLYNLNGTYLTGFEQKEARAFEPLRLQYERFDEVNTFVNKNLTTEQRHRLNNLLMLVDGFQSALSLEVLASVDFILKENGPLPADQVLEQLQTWSDRKKRLIKERYVLVALAQLDAYKTQVAFT